MACEKSITIQPETQKSLLVVDGTIENGEAPYIILSNSLNYFSAINPQILVSSLVSNAKVTLSDGARTVQLKEYSQRIGGFNLVYYSHDTTTTTGMMTGTEGGSYTLNIDYNSSSYSAVTHIPVVAKTVDSLWWKPAPQNRDTTLVVLMAKLNDPKGYGNYIRYYTRVNSSNFLPGFNSVFDDQVVDGMVYDTQVDRGFQRDGITNDEEYGFFKRGDTITTKLANIDKATFDFWRTLEFSYQSVGNPFANPTKVLGNVGNGALGAFCGYGVQYNTLIVPK
ncbi:MAG: hypothetical protein JWQ40_942 [Segetibacter sp.]|nr:hypothetical protein [Segetibacter sp.]